MIARPPATRPILVVARGWPQQEDPALPLIPAGAPAVLAGRVSTATTPLPADIDALVRQVEVGTDLELPATAVLQAVCEHAVRAAGVDEGELRLVAADVGGGGDHSVLVYALLTPKGLAPAAMPS